MTDTERLTQTASQVRRDILRMVTQAGSGHPGGSLSSTDLTTTLFFKIMKHSPEHWDRSGKGNDMFFLSAGHMSPLFYSVLARSGYFPVKELATFRHLGSRLQGHPSTDHGLPGVYMPSGSLGQRRRRERGGPDMGGRHVRRTSQDRQPHRHDRLEPSADRRHRGLGHRAG